MIKIVPSLPLYPLGIIRTHYLNIPTGIAIEVAGNWNGLIKQKMKFVTKIAEITNDHDLAIDDKRVKVPIKFEE